MTFAYLSRSALSVLAVALAAACSSSMRTSPDAPPDVHLATDVSIVTSDGDRSDGGGEAPGETRRGGAVTVSPMSIDLGTLALGQVVASQITVTATSDVSDLSVVLDGASLSLDGSSTCGSTLAAGVRCVVVFRFVASAMGDATERITITAGGEPTMVLVTAKVRNGAHLAITPASAMFAATPGGTSAPVTFKVGNVGGTEIGPLSVTIEGSGAANFAATAIGCELIAPGGICTISVVFTPKAGTCVDQIASLVVTGPVPDSPTATAALAGRCSSGGPPFLLTSPTSDLGSVAVGTTGPSVTFTVTSQSAEPQGPFTITLTPGSGFVITGDTCSTSVLALAGACTISIALRPTVAGSKSAVLTVATSSYSTGTVVTGTGIDSSTDAGSDSSRDGADLDTNIVGPLGPGLDASSESHEPASAG